MKIIVATTQVPFVRGGAEILAEGLLDALREAGYETELVTIPFKWYPPERILDIMLASSLIDLSESCGEKIDRLIGLKFPAYLIPHPRKVIWLLHQHRQAYELWGTPLGDLEHYPNGIQIRDTIINADNKVFREANQIFTISKNVAKRLKKYNQVEGTPLYHPPQNADFFYCQNPCDYFFYPSRINPTKRQELIIYALNKTKSPFKVVFAGSTDTLDYKKRLEKLAEQLGISNKVSFIGFVSEQEKRKLYANSIGTIYCPYDEDYGYVTLESMLSKKPILTCQDSGGPTELIKNKKTGLVVENEAQAIADAMEALWYHQSWSKHLGEQANEYYKCLNISWSTVVEKLMA
jgi:glycosyltransferase involved in cell wall biosynthesis